MSKKAPAKRSKGVPSPTSRKVHEVVSKVLADPVYGKKLQAEAKKALTAGMGSDEWNSFFENFAATPGELSNLGGAAASSSCSKTIITLSIITTPVCFACGLTTTTTTSN